ncbi:MAG: nicotinate-nicotinamide nucleotide adenylyltransferase [Candidatus Saccharimonadales bacterium]
MPTKTNNFQWHRIGIYAGGFDPVHLGHITFALQAAETARLDKVIFLPERRPLGGEILAHFGHRAAMIARAIRPYPRFNLLELPDMYFSAAKTLPKLQKIFAGDELVFMKSSADYGDLTLRPEILDLGRDFELAIGFAPGVRPPESLKNSQIHLIEEIWPPLNPEIIRRAMLAGVSAEGLLKSVRAYAAENWLYASLA